MKGLDKMKKLIFLKLVGVCLGILYPRCGCEIKKSDYYLFIVASGKPLKEQG